jgi:hypothetical protein
MMNFLNELWKLIGISTTAEKIAALLKNRPVTPSAATHAITIADKIKLIKLSRTSQMPKLPSFEHTPRKIQAPALIKAITATIQSEPQNGRSAEESERRSNAETVGETLVVKQKTVKNAKLAAYSERMLKNFEYKITGDKS